MHSSMEELWYKVNRTIHRQLMLASKTIDPPTPGLETLSIAYKFVLFIYYILHYNCR